MLRRLAHHVEHLAHVRVRDLLVEEVRHAVHQDEAARLPPERKIERVGDEAKIEALLEGVAGHATEMARANVSA